MTKKPTASAEVGIGNEIVENGDGAETEKEYKITKLSKDKITVVRELGKSESFEIGGKNLTDAGITIRACKMKEDHPALGADVIIDEIYIKIDIDYNSSEPRLLKAKYVEVPLGIPTEYTNVVLRFGAVQNSKILTSKKTLEVI